MKKFLHRLLAVLVSASLLIGSMPVLALGEVQIVSAPTGGNYNILEEASGEAPAVVQVQFLDWDNSVLKTDTVNAGDAYPNENWPTPSRAGYAFTGWSDGSSIVSALNDIQANVTLTAQYVQLFTVTFENWDGTVLYTVPNVRAGTDFIATNYYSATPTRTDFSFDRWEPQEIPSLSADTTITAVFSPLSQHTIVINYVFKNQKQAAEPFIAVVSDGYQFTQTVTSPDIMGYAPDLAEVTIADPITQDYNIDVTYLPLSDTRYLLVHKQQDLTGGGYTAVDTEERSGETGSMTTVGEADVNTYDGFNLLTNLYTVNKEIAADGTTVVELLYDRQIHFVLFDTANGTYIEPQVGLFGTAVITPANPTRVGYTFNGWDKVIPATIGSTDVTITAKWTPQTVGYTIVVWRENANDSGYSYATTITGQTALAGSTVSTFNTSLINGTTIASTNTYFTYSHVENTVVAGDGSSVLNVYYSRNVYLATFQLTDKTGVYLVANGQTIYHSTDPSANDYTFSAKYESNITALWPSNVGPSGLGFSGWKSSKDNSTNTSKRLTFTSDLLDATFVAQYEGKCTDTLVYMLETPDDTGTAQDIDGVSRYYLAKADLAQVVSTKYNTRWNHKQITGFTAVGGDPVSTIVVTAWSDGYASARTVTLYYSRNKYKIDFNNKGTVTSVNDIFFELSITDRYYTPVRPDTVPTDYVFTGWYTSEACYEDTLFVWTGATMPASNMVLFAGWKKPSYPVVFELNYENGGVYTQQVVIKGNNADQVTNPTRPGYHFDYWYYLDGGVEKLFTFSMPITRAYDLYAHWTASVVAYTVRYIAAGGGAVYNAAGQAIPNKTGADSVSTLITEAALAGYTSGGSAMYPDRLTSSLALDAVETNNVITFTYVPAPQVYYIVRYVDTNGTAIAPSQGPLSTSQSIVTVRYQNIVGYSPTTYQQTVVLAAETSSDAVSQNIITFVYTPNPLGKYIVNYYLQNINDNGYTQDTASTVIDTDLPFGAIAHAVIKSYTGFTYVSGISVVSGVVHSDSANPLTLSVYYNRNMVGYSVSYWDEGLTPMERLTTDTTGTARYGKQLSLFAKDITGYRLDSATSPSPATLTIGTAEAANHVDFYYNLRTDIAVVVRFLDESGVNIAASREFTGSNDRNVKLGSAYAYTLLESEKVILYNGETYRHLSTEADTASLTVAEYGNYLDFHYVPDTYAVAYHANGGTGAPTDANRYRAFTAVDVAAGTPAYGQNKFEGWTLNTAAVGQVYETQAALSAITLVGDGFTMPAADVTLYAVWSHLTAMLTYACDTPFTGSLPSGSEVPINTPTTVAGAGSMARDGYTFAGWQLKDGGGQLSGPVYGPGTSNTTISIAQNTTLYAIWAPVGYTVAYQNNLPAAAQSRYVNPNTLTAYNVESADFTLQAPSCSGYDFLGWYTDAAYQNPAPAPALPTGSTGDRVFYARFTLSSLDGLRVDDYTGVYDAASHGVTFVDAKNQLLPTDTVSYSTPNAYVDVTGSPVPVTVTVRRDGVVIWTDTGYVSITPRTISLSASDINVLFDGQPHSLDVTVPSGVASAADAEGIRQALTYSMGGVAVANSFTDAMVQTTVTVAATYPNYTILPATPTVTIGKRPVTITADNLTGVIYDGNAHSVTTYTVAAATDTSGLIAGDAVGSVVLSDNTRTLVGTSVPTPSQATLSTGKAANYAFTYLPGVLEIVQSDALTLTLSAGAGTYVYDGLSHGFTADTAGVPVTLEYRIGSGDWQTVTAQNPLPSYTEAGSYPLTVRASNPNYSNQPTDSKTLVITPRPVTVRAGSGSFAYTGATFTVTNWSVDAANADTGLVGTDAITAVALSGNSRSALGSNSIGISVTGWSVGANPGNYSVTTVPGTIAVTQNAGALQVATDDVTLTYDGDAHRLSYTVTVPDGTPYTVYYRLDGGDWTALATGATLPTQTTAGVYVYELKIESPNYTGVGTDTGTLTIRRRAVTFTAGSSLGNVYDGDPVSVTYTVSQETETDGLLAGQSASAVLQGTPQTEAGLYAVTFDQAQTHIKRGGTDVTANYDIAYVNGQIEITQAPSQAERTQVAFVYDAQAHTYLAPVLKDAAGNAISGVTVAWSATPLVADAAGWSTAAFPTQTQVKGLLPGGAAEAYQIYVRLTQPDYQTQIVTASLMISPLPVTLTADTGDNFPYTLLPDGTAKVWSIDTAHWQATGLAADTLYAGDTVAYTLANNTQSEVGDGHAVTFATYGIANAAHAINYSITTVDGHIRVVRGTAEALLTGEGLNLTYDALAHALPLPTVTVATEGGDPVDRTAEFTITYTVTHDGDTQVYTTLPTFTDAGGYTVKIKATSDVYADPKSVTVQVNIAKKPLTLTSQTLTVPYDTLPHTVAVLASAVGYAIPAHAVDAAALTMLAGQVNTATLAGLYPVEIDLGSVAVYSGTTDVTDNYAVAIVPGELRITPTTVTAAQLGLQDVTVVYDGQNHQIAMPGSVTVSGHTVDLTDTARFHFSFTSLDLQVAGALPVNEASNPAYTDASAHQVMVQVTDTTGSLVFEPASASVTVTPRDVTITPDDGNFVYDGTEHVVTKYTAEKALAGGSTGLVGSDAVTVTLAGNRRTDAGTNPITWSDAVMAVGKAANYTFLHAEGTMTVAAADALVLDVTALGGVYDAKAHGYTYTVNEPDAAALTLEYSLNGVDFTPFSGVAALPTYVNAGSYPITIRASSPNFAAPATDSATLVISPRPVAVTPTDISFDYDGTPKTLSLYTVERADVNDAGDPVGGRGLLGSDAATATLTNNVQTNAGVYTVGSRDAQAVGGMRLANYAFEYGTGTLTILKRTGLAITLTPDSAPYDGLPHGFTYTTNAVGVYTLEYSTDGGATWTPFTDAADLPTRVNAGDTPLTVRVTNPNYETPTATASATLTVSPVALTLTVVSDSVVYDGAPHSLSLSAAGLVGGDTLGTYTLNPASRTDAGIYAVQAVQGDTTIVNPSRPGNLIGNYSVTFVPGTLTIVDFGLTGYQDVYDGGPHGVTVTVPDDFTPLYDISYVADGTPVTDPPSYTDVGTHTVTVILTPKDPASGLPTFSKDTTVEITAKTISLLVDSINKTYDGAYSALTVSLPEGAAANSVDAATLLANVTFTAGGASIANAFVNAGATDVSVTSTCPNYIVVPVPTTVRIARRSLTITAGSATKVYDEQPVTVSYSSNAATYAGSAVTNAVGLLRQHLLTAVLVGATQTDVCTEAPVTFDQSQTTITEGGASVLANYDVTYVAGKITITRETALTLNLGSYSGVYDAQAHSVSVLSVMDGARSVDTANFTWTYGLSAATATDASLARTDVCDLLVYVRGVSIDGNYPDVSGAARLTITPRPVLVTPGSATYVYDGTERAVESYTTEKARLLGGALVDGRGLIGADDLTVTLHNNRQTLPGTYPITWTDPVMGTGSLSNYSLEHGDASLVIEKATSGLTIAVEDDARTYDAEPHRLTYTVTAPAGVVYAVAYSVDNGLTYTALGAGEPLPESTAAGTYPVKVRVTSPYYVDGYESSDDATLTLNQRTLNITSGTQSFVYDQSEHTVPGLWKLTTATLTAGLVGGAHAHAISSFSYMAGKGNAQTVVGGHAVLVDAASVTVVDATGADVTANYAITADPGRIDVTAQPVSLAATTRSVTYDGQPQGFTLPTLKDAAGNPVTEPITYTYSLNGTDWSATPITYENVTPGGYDVFIRAVSPNYAPAQTTAHLTIEPAPITVTADTDDSFIFTVDKRGDPVVWSVDSVSLYSGTLYKGETFAFALSDNTQSEVGAHDVVLDSCAVMLGAADVSQNYAITLRNGHITVSQGVADAYMSATPLTGVYDSAGHTLAKPVISVQADTGEYVDMTSRYSFTYVLTKEGSTDTQTFTNELPHVLDAGVYHVAITATSGTLASPVTGETTITIAALPITFTSGNNSAAPYTYTGAEQSVTAWQVAVGALAGRDAVSAYGFAAGQANVNTDACDRAVLLSTVTILRGSVDVTANYQIAYTAGHIVIQPLIVNAGLSLTGETHVYDGGPHRVALGDVLTTSLGDYSLSGATTPSGAKRFTVTYAVTPLGGVEGAKSGVNPSFTNVSTQSVTVYVTDATGNLTIRPASATVAVTPRSVTIKPDSLSTPYDGLPHTVTGYEKPKAVMAGGVALGTTGLVGDDDVTVTLVNNGPHTVPGEYTITWSDPAVVTVGSADNYTFVHDTGLMSITKATGIDVTLTAENTTYDGKPHGYTVVTNVPDGTPVMLEYQTPTGWVEITPTQPLPTQIAAGDYPLTVRVSSPYYTDTDQSTATLHIAQRALTVSSGDNSAAPYTYTGLAQSVAAALVSSLTPLAVGDALDPAGNAFVPGLNNENTDACDRPVTLSAIRVVNAAGDTVTANYAITLASGRIVIGQAASGAVAATRSEPYLGVPYAFATPVLTDGAGVPVTGVSYAYSLTPLAAGDAGWTPITSAFPTREDVKRGVGGAVEPYVIYVRVSHPNYGTQVTTSTLTIQPAPLTVTAGTNDSFVYTLSGTGDAVVWSVTDASITAGNLYKGTTLAYTLANNTQAEVGGHPVFVDTCAVMFGLVDYTGNYSIQTLPGHIAVNKGTAASAIYASGDVTVYDALGHAIPAPMVAVLATDGSTLDRTADFTLAYDVALTGSAQTWHFTKLSDMKLTEAGVYVVTISATSDLHADPANAVVTLTIQPRPVSVQSGDNSAAPYTYSGREQSVAGDETVLNLLPAHRLTNLTYAAGQSNASTDVCDRPVLLTGASVTSGGKDVTANYVFTFLPGWLTIQPLVVHEADIPVSDVTAVYDGEGHALSLPPTVRTDIGTLKTTDEFTVQYRDASGVLTDTPPAYVDVGEYPVTVILTSKSGNFAPEEVPAVVKVTPKPLTVAYGTLSAQYDGLPHTVPLTLTGLVSRDSLLLTEVNRTATDATRKPDGTYGPVVSTATGWSLTSSSDPSVDRSANYTLTIQPGSLEVKPIPITVTVTSETFPYDGLPHSLTGYTVKGSPLPGDEITAKIPANTATFAIDSQTVTLTDVTVMQTATGLDVSDNYLITSVPGTLTVERIALSLLGIPLTVLYDGLPHQPDVMMEGTLVAGDTLVAYTLANMPQTDVGVYSDIRFGRSGTVILNAAGQNVTQNYLIRYYGTTMNIVLPDAAYTVRYYYDGVLGSSATLSGTRGDLITAYPPRLIVGYQLDHTDHLPLRLLANAARNVISVYYTTVSPLATLEDVLTPLGGNAASYERGNAID